MAEPGPKMDRLSYADYLALPEQEDERHIFWDGEVFAMAGGSLMHIRLETTLIRLLGNALLGRTCEPMVGNQRLRALQSDRAAYADAVVVCGPPAFHPEDRQALTNPTVVFEVLSRSTEAFDRGDKFAWYRSFESLRSVVLISQKARRVERYAKDERGLWTLYDLGPEDTLSLPEIDVAFSLAELYAGTEGLEAEPAR